MAEKSAIGCGEQRCFFGATYEDGVCIDGYMWDLDSCEEPGGPLLNGGDTPCPNCNRGAYLCWVYDLDDPEIAELFKKYRDEQETDGYKYQQGDEHIFADALAIGESRFSLPSELVGNLNEQTETILGALENDANKITGAFHGHREVVTNMLAASLLISELLTRLKGAAPSVTELAELQATFDLRYAADMRAIKRWQETTGRTQVWPDHADLVVWLLEQLEAKV